MDNRIALHVILPDFSEVNMKEFGALKEVEKALEKYGRSSIEWEVLDNGDRQSFEVYNYKLCEDFTGIHRLHFVYDVDKYEYAEEIKGFHWYVTEKNIYVGGNDPEDCIRKYLEILIQKRRNEIELLEQLKP